MRWVTFATTPLSTEAISTAIAVEIEADSIDPDDIPDHDSILWWCSSLVSKDERTGTLALSHFTVKEFLVNSDLLQLPNLRRYHMDEGKANKALAKVCLSYIFVREFSGWQWRDSSAMQQKVSEHPFLKYAGTSWPKHAQCHDGDDLIFTLTCRLLHPQKTKAFFFWLWVYNSFGQSEHLPNVATTLQIAASFGLSRVCEWLLTQESDIDASNPYLGTPLMCSIRGGPRKERPHLGTFLFFLDRGASAYTQLKRPFGRHETPMSLALDCALIDPELSQQIFTALSNLGTITSFASSNFWENTHKLTTSGKACMIAAFTAILKFPAMNTPLYAETRKKMLKFVSKEAAVVYGDNETHPFHFLTALIQNGTDARTLSLALPGVSGYGHVEVVDLLLERCPFEIPEIYAQIQKAWIEATTWGHVEVLKTLVKHGIHVDMHVPTAIPEERIGLACAVFHGALKSLDYFDTFPIIDYNIRVGDTNLLHMAVRSRNNRLQIVKRLLSKGLDPLEVNPNGQSLLHTRLLTSHALSVEDFELFQLLVECGCNVETVDNDGSSLLHIFLSRDLSGDTYTQEIMLLILGDGKMKHVPRNDGLLPLNCAVRRRQATGCIRLAIPNNLSLYYSSGATKFPAAKFPVLHDAVTPNSHSADDSHMYRILDLLLKVKGINLDMLNGFGDTPLITAAQHCKFSTKTTRARILQKLLENGAAPDIQNARKWTASHFLAAKGFEQGLREVLSFNPDLHIRNDRGYSPLHEAIHGGELVETEERLYSVLSINQWP